MSSFKRKSATTSTTTRQLPLPGTRASSHSQSVLCTSSGVASFDDILGGGLVLGTVLVALAPDVHSAWGTLLQRYVVAQGISLGQSVHVVSDSSKSFVEGCMWRAGSKDIENLPPSSTTNTGEPEEPLGPGDNIKIAWRYEKMQQFQTSVPSSSASCMLSKTLDCFLIATAAN